LLLQSSFTRERESNRCCNHIARSLIDWLIIMPPEIKHHSMDSAGSSSVASKVKKSGNTRSSAYAVKKSKEAASKVTDYFHEVGVACPLCYRFLGSDIISICGFDAHVICKVCSNKLPNRECPLCRKKEVGSWSDEAVIENIFPLLEDVKTKISNRREEKALTFYLQAGSKAQQSAVPPQSAAPASRSRARQHRRGDFH
jgi:hypothetical protein